MVVVIRPRMLNAVFPVVTHRVFRLRSPLQLSAVEILLHKFQHFLLVAIDVGTEGLVAV